MGRQNPYPTGPDLGLTVLDIFAELPDADPIELPPAPTDGDEVRWVYFTSGTTSDPKGVRHTDRTLITGANGLAVALDMSPDDVGSIAFPFAHIAFDAQIRLAIGELTVDTDAGLGMNTGGNLFGKRFVAGEREDDFHFTGLYN